MKYLFILLSALSLCFCQPPPAHPNDPVQDSAEEITQWEVYKGDTINRLDSKGRKQGKWIKLSQGDQQDTSYYKDGIKIDGRKE